ncbi:N-acetyl-gamma-glutamyl-phosphate reductase [Ulvibacter antarcticus]|uniref:N-acetyl-gamma-glutamyl-phosphate reductase n=1 Tax=Ulvibacter antarcticus TaxID=442714 RepID=A0A3L9Y958_9FLAO|nr:N-acetyl-gamma-glutamyl-phosphate reductase [Ulvibacter antarcticus]RMA57231.1 N-acetyl-gamma-glutamyl-phosphate reductase [Ulvibacter antarcticus]
MKIQVGIVGGAGYTAGELIRILINHSKVVINFVYSTSNEGNKISSVHQDLVGETELVFTKRINSKVDVLFLCLGHGNSKAFLEVNEFSEKTRIIDLSNDFRLNKDSIFKENNYIYGLPELQKERIKTANYIANPGCFATAIQLGLLPLAKNNLLKDDIHVNAVTGSTGAGTSLSETIHFSWRTNNLSHYKAFSHQHLDEINESIVNLQSTFSSEIIFIPNRGNFSRGIFATLYTKYEGSIEDAKKLYNTFYTDAEFVFVFDEDIHLKQVVNTNKCIIHLHKHNNILLITSILDNLLKGASGQAVQNMNLMLGFQESEGLRLKANFF